MTSAPRGLGSRTRRTKGKGAATGDSGESDTGTWRTGDGERSGIRCQTKVWGRTRPISRRSAGCGGGGGGGGGGGDGSWSMDGDGAACGGQGGGAEGDGVKDRMERALLRIWRWRNSMDCLDTLASCLMRPGEGGGAVGGGGGGGVWHSRGAASERKARRWRRGREAGDSGEMSWVTRCG